MSSMPKYSYVISESFGYSIKNISKNIEDQKDFENALSILKDVGYNGVEIPLMFDIKVIVDRLKETMTRYGMSVSGLSTDNYYSHMNYYLTNSNSAVRARTLDLMMSGLSIAQILSSPLMIGLIIGKNAVDEKSAIWLDASLKILDKKANDVGVDVLIEPINHYETGYLTTIKEAYDLIGNLGLIKTGVLINSYHMNIEEGKYEQSINYAKDKIWHVKLSDNNHLPPGLGHIDFNSILTTLKKIGYDGWYTVECMSKPELKDVATLSMNFIKEKIK
jgi:sugar phosphate isomerase/epimerase